MIPLPPIADIQVAVHSTAMQPTLHETRQRLTSDVRPPEVRFSSIRLERPQSKAGRPAIRGSSNVTFRLGVCPSAPTEILGHLYGEDSGSSLAELQANVEKLSKDVLRCSFVLPPDLPAAGVCLLIEGRWQNQAAGCEMSFDVRS